MAPPAAGPRCTERERVMHDVWMQSAGHGLVLPRSLCTHGGGCWRHLDIDVVVCSTCGQLHVCRDAETCPVILDDMGYSVCSLTGFVLQKNPYCGTEFVDTVAGAGAPVSKRVSPRVQHSIDVSNAEAVFSHVHVYCLEMVTGPKWEHCTQAEAEKQTGRNRVSLYRYLRAFKIKNRGMIPNLVQAVCSMLNSSGGWRNSRCLSEQDRVKLASWCAQAITKHVVLLRSVSKEAVPFAKLRSIAVGLLYQMRNGVVMHETVLLPRCPVLVQVLPQEAFLEPVFGVRGKCITETENLVKNTLRRVGAERLALLLGVLSVDRKVHPADWGKPA